MSMSATLRAELTQHLKDLHLPTIRECFTEQADKARKEELAYERYLLELTRREGEVRRDNRIARLLRESRLPLEKNLATFDRKRLPHRVSQQVQVLLDGSFLAGSEVLFALLEDRYERSIILLTSNPRVSLRERWRFGDRALMQPTVRALPRLHGQRKRGIRAHGPNPPSHAAAAPRYGVGIGGNVGDPFK